VKAATTNSANLSRPKRVAGVALFLVATACWVFGLAAWEEGWIDVSDLAFVGAAGLSAVSVVLTGYLGRSQDALWLGWIPGTAMMAVGFAMSPTPGGDEAGGGLIFLGGLLLILGWPIFFFPLIVAGAYIGSRRAKRLTPEVSA
jgi:hypothetical protein